MSEINLEIRNNYKDFFSAINDSTRGVLGRICGAFLGFRLGFLTGLSWGWRNLRINPFSIVRIEKHVHLRFAGKFSIGYSLKERIPLPGYIRTGLVVMKNGSLKIGKNVSLINGATVHVSPNARIEIGDNTFISYGSQIISRNKISIGVNCAIAWNVTIMDHNLHTFHDGSKKKSSINIGDDVWIGHHVTILPGVNIGNGSVIGANCVVTKDVPAKSLAVGNPARIIKRDITWQI